jgi:hypothetical protein
LSSALCSHFTQTWENEDVEDASSLCQVSLAELSSLHADKYISYMWPICFVTGFYTTLLIYRLQWRCSDWYRGTPQGFPERISQAYHWTVAAEQYGSGCSLSYMIIGSRRETAAAFRYARTLAVDAVSCIMCRPL